MAIDHSDDGMMNCLHCGGSGYDSGGACPICNGSGRVHETANWQLGD